MQATEKQYHIHCGPGDVGRYVFLPGDPGRCEAIAAYFEDPVHIGMNREYNIFTGTLLGEKVSVCSTGIGGPSASIAMEELTGVSFQVVVTDLEGTETTFDYTSDKETVGEALVDEGLISGEDSEYGLFVTTVNGITLDWDKDGKYWAFYINGEYASTGVDSTELTEGAVYSFKPE